MNIKTIFLYSGILLIFFLTLYKNHGTGAESFSTKGLEHAEGKIVKQPEFFMSEGNIRIAYFPYISKNEKANLIVIHGGGAHSNAGYQYIAEGLRKNYNISTYLIDLRGHGLSGDKRGDTQELEYVFKDIQKLIKLIISKSEKPLFLCGHSSGSGVILNYLSYLKSENISGFVFISPEFGYKSGTMRDNIEEPFAKPNAFIFFLSAMSGGHLFKHSTAVNFNYPAEVLKRDKLLVNSYTTNMSYACTPDKPEEQFGKIDKPVLILIGKNDEVIDPDKLKRYIPLLGKEIKDKSEYLIIPDVKHLSVLLHCECFIGDYLLNEINK